MRPVQTDSRTWPIFSLIFLLLLAVGNIFLPLFIVPKFEQIFQDALGPDHPLPVLTNVIIGARIPVLLIVVAWSIAAIVACWQKRRVAIWIINLGLLFFLALGGVTVVALFMPMNDGIITGMSDASLSSSESSR